MWAPGARGQGRGCGAPRDGEGLCQGLAGSAWGTQGSAGGTAGAVVTQRAASPPDRPGRPHKELPDTQGGPCSPHAPLPRPCLGEHSQPWGSTARSAGLNTQLGRKGRDPVGLPQGLSWAEDGWLRAVLASEPLAGLPPSQGVCRPGLMGARGSAWGSHVFCSHRFFPLPVFLQAPCPQPSGLPRIREEWGEAVPGERGGCWGLGSALGGHWRMGCALGGAGCAGRNRDHARPRTPESTESTGKRTPALLLGAWGLRLYFCFIHWHLANSPSLTESPLTDKQRPREGPGWLRSDGYREWR